MQNRHKTYHLILNYPQLMIPIDSSDKAGSVAACKYHELHYLQTPEPSLNKITKILVE